MAETSTLPAGYRWELGGHYLQQQEAFESLLVVMVVAVLLVFIMLAFQFRSVVLPLLIFLTQPLSLVSGLFALWLTNTPLNVSSYMGAILLIGLDMKNGILLVEYIQQLREEGMELRPALLLAGRTRFRPILMTSLAAILGLFPLALGIGPGAQMQQPLAIMVIGGLTANMLFTRMVIPVGYLVLERLRGHDSPARPSRRSRPPSPAPTGDGRSRTAPPAVIEPVRRPTTPRSETMNRRVPHRRSRPCWRRPRCRAPRGGRAADPSLELVQTIVLKGKAGKLDHLALDAKRRAAVPGQQGQQHAGRRRPESGQAAQADHRPERHPGRGLRAGTGPHLRRPGHGRPVQRLRRRRLQDRSRRSSSPTTPTTCATTPATGLVYVAHAEKSLAVDGRQDLRASRRTSNCRADGEAFELEANRPRLYIACPDAGEVAVIDTDKNEVTAHYPVKMAGGVPRRWRWTRPTTGSTSAAARSRWSWSWTRRPARNSAAPPSPAASTTCTSTPSGNGCTPLAARASWSCSRSTDADHVEVVEKIATAEGAKTCLFVPETGRLYLAVPRQEGKDGPEIRVFQAKVEPPARSASEGMRSSPRLPFGLGIRQTSREFPLAWVELRRTQRLQHCQTFLQVGRRIVRRQGQDLNQPALPFVRDRVLDFDTALADFCPNHGFSSHGRRL